MAGKRGSRIVVPEENIDVLLAEMISIADRGVERARNQPGHTGYFSPAKPDIDEFLTATMREALLDEVVPAVITEDGRIAKEEVAHEVAKKALIGLKMAKLRTIARERDLAANGSIEDVATRIARAFRWDEREIAELILANEDEPRPEHSLTDRLFPLAKRPDMDYLVERLSVVGGRYIRVGVAKWFVFETMSLDRTRVAVEGSYRTYNASVDDAVAGGNVKLSATHAEYKARAWINRGHSIATVRADNVTAARGAVDAIRVAGNFQTRGYIVEPAKLKGAAGVLAPSSRFMLDLLYTRLREAGLASLNPTVARFRMDDRQPDNIDSEDEEGAARPALRAVRFEGEHLLDSIAACRLLVDERRALVDVSLVAEQGSNAARFPIRISLDQDHVRLTTGFGASPERAAEVHAAVVAHVRSAIEGGIADIDRLDELTIRIEAIASATVAPTHADLLLTATPFEDDDSSSDDSA